MRVTDTRLPQIQRKYKTTEAPITANEIGALHRSYRQVSVQISLASESNRRQEEGASED